MLSNVEIEEIFNKFVKVNYTNEYDTQYHPLPVQLNNKKWKWEGKDFPRVIAILEFKKYMEKYGFNFKDVLSFNADNDPEFEYVNYQNLTNINYDEDPENNDIHKFQLNKKFDFVMMNQTIEHLCDPIRAMKNLYEHLNPGGVLYANVPANNRPHSEPYHYYTGITPVGLGVMAKIAGFKILEIGQWGNKEHLHKLFNVGWIDYRQMENTSNDRTCPIITWILAQK
jgi:SAM-dependent methyltransferase